VSGFLLYYVCCRTYLKLQKFYCGENFRRNNALLLEWRKAWCCSSAGCAANPIR